MVVVGSMLNDIETFLIFHLESVNMASMVAVLRRLCMLCVVFLFIIFIINCCVVDEATSKLVMRVRKKGKEIRMTFDRGRVSYWMQLNEIVMIVHQI